MTRHYTTHTTHPAPDLTKKVCPAPAPSAGPETPQQRCKRLMVQAAANRLRVRPLGEGCYRVPSQRKGADNRPLALYTVRAYPGLGWSCDCVWGDGDGQRVLGHGLYCDENPLALCAHIAQVLKHVERAERETARLAARLTERLTALATGQGLTSGDIRDLANAGLAELPDPTPYEPTEGPVADLARAERQARAVQAGRDLFGEGWAA